MRSVEPIAVGARRGYSPRLRALPWVCGGEWGGGGVRLAGVRRDKRARTPSGPSRDRVRPVGSRSLTLCFVVSRFFKICSLESIISRVVNRCPTDDGQQQSSRRRAIRQAWPVSLDVSRTVEPILSASSSPSLLPLPPASTCAATWGMPRRHQCRLPSFRSSSGTRTSL